MKLKHTQKGITLFSLAFFLMLLGFVVFVILKLFPVYMDDMSLKSSLESMAKDTTVEYSAAIDVRSTVIKNLGLNNITQVSLDDISVKRDGDIYNINIDYEVRVPFIKNIDLAISFTNHAEVRAR